VLGFLLAQALRVHAAKERYTWQAKSGHRLARPRLWPAFGRSGAGPRRSGCGHGSEYRGARAAARTLRKASRGAHVGRHQQSGGRAAIAGRMRRFGRLDVVINNAATDFLAPSRKSAKPKPEHRSKHNLFGALWVTQAALPIMRAQVRDHIHSGLIDRRASTPFSNRWPVSSLEMGS